MTEGIDRRNPSASSVPPGFVSELPEEAARTLVASGEWATYAAGRVIRPPRPAVVVEGSVRVFVEGADGRRAEVRQLGPGDVVGLASCFLPDLAVTSEALSQTTVIHFSRATLEGLMYSDPGVGVVVAGHLAERVRAAVDSLREHAFGSARRRLAAELLSRARRDGAGRLAAWGTQQELADAIGAVREHVARLLRELRESGAVNTHRRLVVITDSAALRQLAKGG